jgi:hypothetical protein
MFERCTLLCRSPGGPGTKSYGNGLQTKSSTGQRLVSVAVIAIRQPPRMFLHLPHSDWQLSSGYGIGEFMRPFSHGAILRASG